MEESQFYRKISYYLALIVICLAFLVELGWWFNIPALIQILPSLVPMQFNTALMFILSAIGVVGYLKSRPFVGMIFGGFVALFATVTFLQYVFDFNTGLDQLFKDPQITTRTAHPGRMAPNTAVGFMFCGIAIFVYQLKRVRSHAWIAACLSMVAFSFGFVALLGYFSDLEDAYGWATLSDMAVHTGFCFLLLGGSIFFSSLTIDHKGKVSSWVIVPVMVASLFILIFLWRAVEVQRIRVIEAGGVYETNLIIVTIILIFLILAIYLQKKCVDITITLEQSKLQTEVSNQTKTVILRYVSHEVRNPLNAVIGFSEPFLDRAELQGEVKEAMDCIYTASIHMKSVVDDLLAVSRFDSGKIQIDTHEYLFRPWIQNLAKALTKRAEKQSIQFENHFQEDIPEKLKGDSSKLAQIIINLVENAFKYTSQGGKVILSVWVEDENLNIKVEDTGRGISKEAQEKLFDPFFQVQKSDTKIGLGLGLSIVKQFIDMMEGKIEVSSEEGKGTTFHCKIKAYLG
ncbi:MAG: HAMP domain-containing histidine kinase [Chlamydiales bacterium]|nr:HAMP domain-containing histidine kinase [Chlamydiales bacterium]